jgi:hypothetical protein
VRLEKSRVTQPELTSGASDARNALSVCEFGGRYLYTTTWCAGTSLTRFSLISARLIDRRSLIQRLVISLSRRRRSSAALLPAVLAGVLRSSKPAASSTHFYTVFRNADPIRMALPSHLVLQDGASTMRILHPAVIQLLLIVRVLFLRKSG